MNAETAVGAVLLWIVAMNSNNRVDRLTPKRPQDNPLQPASNATFLGAGSNVWKNPPPNPNTGSV